MPRRPRKVPGAKSKPRPVDRKESKIKRWDKASDIPLDDEDQFHASRDKILLDGNDEDEDLDDDEEEVFGLDLSDEESDEDEPDGQQNGDDDDEDIPAAPTKSKSKKSKKTKKSESESESEEEGWGRGRSAYYSSNAAQLDSDDEEANELEEQEARRLQSKTRDSMQDDDFGLDDVAAEPILIDPIEEEQAAVMESVPQDPQALIRHLEKTNPESLALARDWEETAERLTETRQKIAEMADGPGAGMAHLHYQTLLSYATALAFYLHLRSNPKYARRPELLRNHPVMGRLLTLKQALITLEDLGFAASDSDLDDFSDEDGEGDGLDEPTDMKQLWALERLKGLDEGELQALLDDAGVEQEEVEMEMDEPRPKKRRKTSTEKKAKAPPTPALPVFDLVEPEFTTSTTERRPEANDDAYGEATFLQHADATDKKARRKTLRFHTSKIESASARRQGARSQAIGGDDDLPYREAKRQTKPAPREDAGADLDDSEPLPKDAMDETEDAENAEGYYELVKRASKEKKAKKKADYVAAVAAARPDFEDETTDGPRSLTRAILTNRGLTPRRPKSVRNPRVKKREKFRKANMKVSSQKAVYKGGLAETGRYDGERSGISKVIKSVRLDGRASPCSHIPSSSSSLHNADGPVRYSPRTLSALNEHRTLLFPAYVAVAALVLGIGAKLRPKATKDPEPRIARDPYAWAQLVASASLVAFQSTVLSRRIGAGSTLDNGLLLATYSYVALLLLVYRRSVQADVVLIACFVAIAYRDLYPLATYTEVPQDEDEGWLMWAKCAALTISGAFVPLFRQRLYTPVNPQDPMEKPTDEQTSSWFSSFTYLYLDTLIFRAFMQGGLKLDEIPVLADSDSNEYLMSECLPILDPQSPTASKSLLIGIFKFYRWSYTIRIAQSFFMHTLQFANPVIMKGLLRSLETDEPTYRPWVWVILLFAAPTARSLTMARYVYHSTRQRVQLEGILIQLLFRHSLRLRLTSSSKSEKSDSKNFLGRMNNLVTTDVSKVSASNEFWINFVVFPLQIALGMWFLYSIVGWSALVGLAIIIVTLPIPYFLANLLRKYQTASRKKTDARVQAVTESVAVLRMIKSFALEEHIKQDIVEKRKEELKAVWIVRLLTFLNKTTNFIIPLLIMLGTFSTYTLIMKQKLTASIVFTALTVLDGILRPAIERAMENVPSIVQAKVSLDRIDDFLKTSELLDSVDDVPMEHSSKIGFQDATFSWSANAADDEFKLRAGAAVVFIPGIINVIVGPTGSGKTAMLLALLGEMHVTPISRHAWVNLPRHEGVAYAAQQPWIENATFKQNIVFDARVPFDEDRYKKVLHACALLPDLEIFAAGDETEIGEKGLSLSGGQRARVSLARAIYSSAKVVLLDDIFSALDVHTAKWIVKHCFSSDLVKGRTVILVTHHISLVRPICGHVVAIASDGSISQGSVERIHVEEDPIVDEEQATAASEESNDVSKSVDASRGKLIVAEKAKKGMVGWSSYALYFGNLSTHPALFMGLVIALLGLNEATSAFQAWWLGYWSRQYAERPTEDVNAPYYLNIYSGSAFVAMVLYIASLALFASGALRAIRIVHEKLIAAIMGTTFRWLDTTPMSRVITRATQDTNKVDGNFTNLIVYSLEKTVGIVAKFVAVMIISPSFLLPGVLVTAISAAAGWVYLKAQMPLQREMSSARSPMIAHFSAAIAGLTSIRAYGVQSLFLKESAVRIDLFSRPAISFWNLNRWITVRSDTFGAVYSAALGWYLLMGPASDQDAANVGFSLTMAMSMTGMILWWVRGINNLQLEANSLERIEEYIEIEQESKPTPSAAPPAYWPASGQVTAENLSARYSLDGPEVLRNINFRIESGERIGIVGRTGSGKSSLTLALLRFIPTEGEIRYDTLPVTKINLDALRSNITVIPQVPELLAGTIRANLDPFGAHEDAALNDALRGAGLFSLRIDGETSGLTLDSVVDREGSNLSLGERQIVAMARAIVRRTPLVVLDEATSAIDFETDALIQRTLRTEFQGTTVISVAHRLQSVMDYDRIMVLDAGSMVEFGSPKELVAKEKGLLRAMVEESADRDVLRAMASGKHH
uniref:Uncharacterized protein n=1 Tax=Mycena chlorophos TaxID=658473 RepID=A0ABQ0M7E5_MYCCL|nr:predicted protein [Mycena chlorophos]